MLLYRVASAAVLAAAMCQVVVGQPPVGGPSAELPPDLPAPATAIKPLTVEEVRERLGVIEKAEGLDEATKARLKELLEQALGELDRGASREAEAVAFDQMVKAAPDEIRKVIGELEQTSTVPAVSAPDVSDLASLRHSLNQEEEKLAKAKTALEALEAEPKRRASRRKEIPALQTAAREKAAELARLLLAAKSAQEMTPVVQAERMVAAAQHQRLLQELAALDREVAAYDATTDLVRRRRDLAALQLLRAEATVNRWRELVESRRTQEAKNELAEAQRVKDEAAPSLKPLAEMLCKLAKESEDVAKKTRELSSQSEETGAKLDDLQRRFNRSRECVAAAGLTYAVGSRLRKDRASLPDDGLFERLRRARQPEVRAAQFRLFELEDQRAEMASLEQRVQDELQKLDTLPAGMTHDKAEKDVRDILSKTRAQLDALLHNYNEYFETLVRLDETEQQLVKKTRQYADFIDQRIFWIGSADPLQTSDVREAAAALRWVATGSHWLDVGRTLAAEAWRNPALDLLAVLGFGVLLYNQKRLRVRLSQLGEAAKRSTACEILPTVKALVETLLIVVMWPAVLAYVAWRLVGALAPSEFVLAVAAGLRSAAIVYLPLESARQVCRRNGLGEAHFGWPPRALELVRHNLKWFIPVLLPLVFLGAMFRAQSREPLDNSLGRVSTIASLLVLAVLAHRVLRPDGPFFRQMSAAGRQGWPYRLRRVWYSLGVFVPLALALLAGLGYYYTCLQLAVRLWESACLPLGLAVVGAFLYRWVMVVRRRLAIDRVRQRLAAAQEAARTEATEGGAAATTPAPSPPESEVDLRSVAEQTRRLIHSFLVVGCVICLWCIWADALPALEILDQVSLVPSDAWPGGQLGVATGKPGITLADVGLWLFVVLVVAMTVIASRNVPGLLEIAMPRLLPLDAGARYAITTISRYTITVVGLVWSCSLLGIRWSTIQWLVAAVSVGLGFGLQEVFANFICGLILLFERPIRVGDIVTVEEVSGVVSRIQIRATTVTTWDRKEFVVPNKEFITGRLLNWTLSDMVNRVVLEVGIAYGSDTTLARSLLIQVALEHPHVMKDPAPNAMFEGFGDSALKLKLLCYLPNFENRLQVIHDLHETVHRVFAEQGIEIAFPQRDIRIRSDATPLSRKPTLG